MQIYIEYVILDNCVIDYILLRLIDITTGQKIGKVNKFFVCILGTIFAIFLPYLYTFKILLFGYRIITSVVLVMCIKKYKKFKNFLTYYALFVAYTFLIGGSILGLIQLLGIEYSMSGIFMYSFEFPLGLFVLILLLFFKVIFGFVRVIKNKIKQANFIYKITLCDQGKKISSHAFLDTGNNINFNHVGVNIISINLFLQLHKDIDIYKILTRNIDNNKLKQIEYICISGIGEGNKYLSFVIDSLEVNGHKFNFPRIAVAMKNFGDYDCILHKDFVKG